MQISSNSIQNTPPRPQLYGESEKPTVTAERRPMSLQLLQLQHQLDGHGTGRHDCKMGTEVNRKIAPITSGSCDDPPFTGVRPVFGDGP
ncbi:hypothetical protein AVEN_246841-1 [Araneus ventricosus]|uniref:Uncharacterized protein n=1 Tax=Araneus ventricosus TaxID=182803 RepID=A0A4Y2WQK7_ARAVE|nr:hypothetical protein AVEN_246841-1 [Araneus ventricosus]